MNKKLKNKIVQLAVSLVFLIIGFFDWKTISGGKGFLLAFYYVNPSWVALILCGFPITKKAFRLLAKGKLKVPFLVFVSFVASISLEIVSFFITLDSGMHHSYIFAAGEIAFLMTLGGWIESLTVMKCKSGIKRLVNLIPKEAFVKEGDKLEKKTLDKINIGDVVVCKSGEQIAVDGIIIEGSCSVDQSSVTGEYLPKDMTVGDNVYGGTMNVNGTILINVTKLPKDMTIAKMVELVKEAEGKRAPIARIADRWVSIIVPSLFILSLAVGLIAGFALEAGIVGSILRAVTVLVVFCPCAFALATPTAMAAGLGNGAKNGILIKSGESLEELSRVRTICFDKTGTLTQGKIVLSDIIPVNLEKEELVRLAAGLEKYSEHPLSLAVIEYAKEKIMPDATDITTIPGIGIKGTVENKIIEIYSFKYATENKIVIEPEIINLVEEYYKEGKTVVIILADGTVGGIFAFSDKLRENAAEVISKITNRGYNTAMLTGDNAKSADFIAKTIGIKTVHSELLPEDKLRIIEKYQSDGQKVCMLGDGINDAPSLKMANVSMAMGAMGSDIALDTADMAILNSDLDKVDYTLKLSKRVMGTIKRNIIVAMCINLVAVCLSLFGILNPVTGALLHNGTSILVVVSSALLLHTPKKK